MALAPHVAQYRQPGLMYRSGSPVTLYRGYYSHSDGYGLSQPHRKGFTIRVYDTSDILQFIISSNSGRNDLVRCRFELLDTGCGSFELELSRYYEIGHDWRIDVHLWNERLPRYSGFCYLPANEDSTDRSYSYTGFGGNWMLDTILLTASYPGQKVHLIARDIIKNIVQENGRLVYDESLIEPSKFSSVGKLNFLREPVKNALKQVSDLAGGFEWGVDERRRVFFRKPSTEVDTHSWVGKHLETYQPSADSSKIVNRYYIKAGKVRTDILSTDPLYKTNHVAEPLEDKGAGSSQERFRVRTGIYNAPSMLSLIDAIRAGAVQLRKDKEPIQKAKVKGLIFEGQEISASGKARITGRKGGQLILPKKRLTFTLTGSRVQLDGEFGALNKDPADVVADITNKSAQEQLARQQSQNQL